MNCYRGGGALKPAKPPKELTKNAKGAVQAVVLDILKDARPRASFQLWQEITETGRLVHPISEGTLSGHLSGMAKAGTIVMVRRGVWQLKL